MYKEKTILGLIPARGGSKGLPRKNLKPLCGKPLIAWTIEQALASKYIDKVIVSTDDEEIAEVSKQFGAEVPFMRPKELATDEAKTVDVVLHILSWFEKSGENFHIVVLLEPTSPLRKNNDIDSSIKLFVDNINKANSLVSIGEVHLENPYLTKEVKGSYINPVISYKENISQRQQLPKAYFPYGVIYLSKVDSFKKYKTFYQESTIGYNIERWQNYEIDDIYDLLAIEAILKYKLGG